MGAQVSKTAHAEKGPAKPDDLTRSMDYLTLESEKHGEDTAIERVRWNPQGLATEEMLSWQSSILKDPKNR